MRIPLIFFSVLLLLAEAQALDERRFVFSYPFAEGDVMAPRGGTTKGPETTLATGETAGWKALRESDLTDFERDRRAILAMAGDYRTSFDFIEVEGYAPDYEPARPYQSWGTEMIRVIEDEGDFISLQHILVTRIVKEDGEISDPIVIKHWRQDWSYQDTSLLEFIGHGQWREHQKSPEEIRGTWSQAVYQVDDAPRYEGVGRWQHEEQFSIWESETTWRPLPRREFSVRDDYDALIGTNTHVITPTGWLHRQDNLKAVIDQGGEISSYVAREYGVNRYRPIVGYDFSPGREYWQRTAPFWADVRAVWQEALSGDDVFVIEKTDGDARRFAVLFGYAGAIEDEYDHAAGQTFARDTLERFVSRAEEAPDEEDAGY